MKKKILVTGGSGYQGVKLIRKLIDEGYSVINIDNNVCIKNRLSCRRCEFYKTEHCL